MEPMKITDSFQEENRIITDILRLQNEKLTRCISDNLYHIIEEALKRKGYKFKDRYELKTFVERHCRGEHNPHVREKVFFVNNEPFLLHKYNDFPTAVINTEIIEGEFRVAIDAGEFYYL